MSQGSRIRGYLTRVRGYRCIGYWLWETRRDSCLDLETERWTLLGSRGSGSCLGHRGERWDVNVRPNPLLTGKSIYLQTLFDLERWKRTEDSWTYSIFFFQILRWDFFCSYHSSCLRPTKSVVSYIAWSTFTVSTWPTLFSILSPPLTPPTPFQGPS